MTVISGTKSKKPSPLICGSLLKFNLSKLKKLKSGCSCIDGFPKTGDGNGVPSTGVI